MKCHAAAGICPTPPRTYGESHVCGIGVIHSGTHVCKNCGLKFNSDSVSVHVTEEINFRNECSERGLKIDCSVCCGSGRVHVYAEPTSVACTTCNGTGEEHMPTLTQYKNMLKDKS